MLKNGPETDLDTTDNTMLGHTSSTGTIIEPLREKTNNVVSEQARHKSGCTVTEVGLKFRI